VRLAGFKVPVDRLSFSALATFMTCPEQFRVERIEKRWGRRGLSGFVGNVHHEAISELLAKRRVESGFIPIGGDITEAFESAWDTSLQEEEPEWELRPADVISNGLKMLGSFVDTLWTAIDPNAETEVWIEETVPGVPVPVCGKVDCWEPTLTREFKTAKQKVSEPKAKWRMQALIYQLFTELPTEFSVTTRQVTPVTWWSGTSPSLALPLGNRDATHRLVVQAVEQMNDCFARYGPDETWPLNGLLHQYQCGYCPAGPKNTHPTCPAWRTDGEAAAA